MKNILNYIKINELISTSGQPKIEEFDLIKNEGFEVVINLALCNASNAIENEDKVVTNLGMSYFHIPVDFENPKPSDLKLFLNTMQALGANKVWVHCAKNYRVSAFMYVYHKYILKTPFEEIDLSIFNIWNPDKTWQELMKISLDDLYKA
ncbi:MAG: protein tyrosine phosphatase family protein [Arcobacter sp.]|jgi:protein tyrosine phosphatase (PTP) superfamily phosphohydrolase (DUF442 family)|uniref:protein tyrosine phosphatase family protein n=1 Tax=unclassified Arcobacter TaxID=2593671 RepID=UPI000229643B|nr:MULTISPECIES: protein tyrosine phosphatase family protein [unclassified Arcobacter]MDY3200072.1 protein tyrosine phosphatase family protein [Arcobacter sp.]BAK73141.1 conserved hypothetical protein [Arcobacter sp. L]